MGKKKRKKSSSSSSSSSSFFVFLLLLGVRTKMSEPMWPSFLEKILDVISLVLTDEEAEGVLKSLPKEHTFTKILRNYSR